MLALIYRTQGDDQSGTLPVAGKPLVVRQLQYLRALGVRRVVIEHAVTVTDRDVRAWMVDEVLATSVELVPTRAPIGPWNLAKRAALPADEAVVAMPASALFDADLGPLAEHIAAGEPISVLGCPPELDGPRAPLDHAALLLVRSWTDLALAPFASIMSGGWGASIRTHADALTIGLAVLAGAPSARAGKVWSVQVHASEREPGVWLARGAVVAPDAKLVGPVLIGPFALVKSGAVIGPGAIVSESAVIERGVHVVDAIVLPSTVVGEGLSIERVAASTRGLIDLETGENFDVDDEAMLAPRESARLPGLAGRGFALALVVVFAPLAAFLAAGELARGRSLARRVRRRAASRTRTMLEPTRARGLLATWIRLLDVLLGRRALIGVGLDAAELARQARSARSPKDARAGAETLQRDAERATPGAICIDDVLTPYDRSPEARLRAMAWYGLAKSTRADAVLVAGLGRPTRTSSAPPRDALATLLFENRSTARPPARSEAPPAILEMAIPKMAIPAIATAEIKLTEAPCFQA